MTGLSDKAAHQCCPVCNTGAGSDDEIFGDNVMPDIDRSGFVTVYCPVFSREAPSIVHLSPIMTLRILPLLTMVTPRPIDPVSELCFSVYRSISRFNFSVNTGRWRYKAIIYARCADNSLKIGTSRPPVSFSTETGVPFPKLLFCSTTMRFTFWMKQSSPMV